MTQPLCTKCGCQDPAVVTNYKSNCTLGGELVTDNHWYCLMCHNSWHIFEPAVEINDSFAAAETEIPRQKKVKDYTQICY